MLTGFMFGANLTSVLLYADQVRAWLTVFDTKDATPEQVAADTERRREEETQHLVTQQAKKVRYTTSLITHPLVSLGIHRLSLFLAGTLPCTSREEACYKPTGSKRQRTKEQPGEAVASAPSQVGEARAERSASH